MILLIWPCTERYLDMSARRSSAQGNVSPVHPGPGSAGEEVILALNKTLPVLRKLFGVRRIGLFGSLARGEEREGSDADVLVSFSEGSATFHNALGLRRHLQEVLGRRVDLVTEKAFAPHIAACSGGGGWTATMRDHLYISRILAEAKFLAARHMPSRPGALSRDETLARAVTGSILIISASASHISPGTRTQFPGVPWDTLAEAADLLVPPYFGTDWILAEDFVFREMPRLIPALETICNSLP